MPSFTIDWRIACPVRTESKAIRVAETAMKAMNIPYARLNANKDDDIPGFWVSTCSTMCMQRWNDGFVQLLMALNTIAKELHVYDMNRDAWVNVVATSCNVPGIFCVEVTCDKRASMDQPIEPPGTMTH